MALVHPGCAESAWATASLGMLRAVGCRRVTSHGQLMSWPHSGHGNRGREEACSLWQCLCSSPPSDPWRGCWTLVTRRPLQYPSLSSDSVFGSLPLPLPSAAARPEDSSVSPKPSGLAKDWPPCLQPPPPQHRPAPNPVCWMTPSGQKVPA